METDKDNKHKVVFKSVWGDSSEDERVIAFWKGLNALPAEVDPIQRARELVFVAYAKKEVIGVTTANRILVKKLNNNPFFNFRVLIDPKYRIPGLVDKMCVLTRDFLEALHKEKKTDCIGMITLVQNSRLKSFRNEAVWPSSGFAYIGRSKAGHHIRILYFKGVYV